jgi:hypothetical protein
MHNGRGEPPRTAFYESVNVEAAFVEYHAKCRTWDPEGAGVDDVPRTDPADAGAVRMSHDHRATPGGVPVGECVHLLRIADPEPSDGRDFSRFTHDSQNGCGLSEIAVGQPLSRRRFPAGMEDPGEGRSFIYSLAVFDFAASTADDRGGVGPRREGRINRIAMRDEHGIICQHEVPVWREMRVMIPGEKDQPGSRSAATFPQGFQLACRGIGPSIDVQFGAVAVDDQHGGGIYERSDFFRGLHHPGSTEMKIRDDQNRAFVGQWFSPCRRDSSTRRHDIGTSRRDRR